MSSPITFTDFTKLPTEIQIQIWKKAVPIYSRIRVVEPLEEVVEFEGFSGSIPTTPCRAHTDREVHALMGTCAASRREALQNRVEFATTGFNLHRQFSYQVEKDILQVASPSLLQNFISPRYGFGATPGKFARVDLRNLAVIFDFTNGRDVAKVYLIVAAVRQFRNLRSIQIVTTTRCQADPIVVNFLATLDFRLGRKHSITFDCVFVGDIPAN